MTTLNKTGKRVQTAVDAQQICARGWQDYMLETKHFLGERHVDDCLKDLSNPQLKKLGLAAADVEKIRSR